eukprot:CCRYP_004534-RA/>CCRYP_004534-RA protein AED:0.09 eAED:-0.02 QI:0/0.5/0.33/1/0.5/0.66/3/250/523
MKDLSLHQSNVLRHRQHRMRHGRVRQKRTNDPNCIVNSYQHETHEAKMTRTEKQTDNDNAKTTRRKRLFPRRQTILACSSITYGIVLVSNYYLYAHFSAPFREETGLITVFFGGYDDKRLQTQREGPSSNLRRRIDPRETLPAPTIFPLGELYDGNTITSILLQQQQQPPPKKDDPSNTPLHLRFKPGTLNLSSQQTLEYCHIDTSIYKQHFPSSQRQVTSISDTHSLIYIMLPKSASSTARWMMENVFNATDMPLSGIGYELQFGQEYENYTTLTFVRDPLSRFYSSYDEVFLRYGPWMRHRTGRAFRKYAALDHPFPYLYENMTEWQDYQESFCPSDLGMNRRECTESETYENGTLAERFERFVWDYDGVSPFDLVRDDFVVDSFCVSSVYVVPHLSNRHTGRPKRIDEIYHTTSIMKDWEYIANFYGESIPDEGEFQARSAPRRFNTSRVSLATKQRICQLSAIDYCCLNLKLPEECDRSEVDIFCSLEHRARGGGFRIQPWYHPHQIGLANRPAYLHRF